MSFDRTIPISRRLISAGGHLKAVTSMVESDVSRKDVLHQLYAVQGALKAVSQMILKEHIRECIEILVANNSPEEQREALDSMLVLYNWTFDHK